MRIILIAIVLAAVTACASAPPRAGGAFTDCRDCPRMVALPAGTFLMGAPDGEVGRFSEEGPTHQVRVPAFAMSRAPITRREYAAFVRATARADAGDCTAMNDDGQWRATPGLNWRTPGFEQSEDHPVVCVSWEDAQAYVAWLSGRTGQTYRLLSEAEFEYAARAGASTTFPWGDASGEACAHANGFDLTAKRAHPDWPSLDCDDGFAQTAPVRAFPPNAFGLYGMSGNVFQWTQDCFAESYEGAPSDGSAHESEPCVARAIRGGSWLNGARGLRAAMRDRDRQQDRYTNIGIRVARSA